MTDQPTLDRNPWPKAAEVIDALGWIQGDMRNDRGVCLTGAIRECTPVPGDWAIITQVAGARGHAEGWNDVKGRTKDQVTGWLRSEAEPITDAELEHVFGPQWEQVVAVVRTIASADPDDLQAYRTACWALWREPSSAYQAAYWAVFVSGGPGGAARRALRAFVADDDSAGVGAALARRHEIGKPGGISREDYDLLTRPYVEHFGPAHPDDAPAVAA